MADTDFITFGPVHLDVVDTERSLAFWRDLVGLQQVENGDGLRLGADGEPLLVLHEGATSPVRRGHTGLYHLAVHLPTEREFARVLARLIAARHPIAPTDHVMSKAVYLDDPDGIGLELTLETPERMRVWEIDESGVPRVIDAQGRVRSGRDPLDLGEVLAALDDDDITRPMPAGTIVGHVHLHVNELEAANRFYRDGIGFLQHAYSARIGMADLHAGGRFPHRLAVNVWQGVGAPPPPPGTAGLRHFTIRYASPGRLDEAIGRLPEAESGDGGRLVRDPAGNAVLLSV
jgi:catechol 2,3-dioxygenase